MKLKDEFFIASADRAKKEQNIEFKARPFNKKIFETQGKLPSVSKRGQTEFYEFRLSKSNAKLANKTYV